MNNEDVQTLERCAKKTQQETLTRFGYEGTSHKGVYRSQFELARKVVLLSLNELSDEPHNAFIKCFASHKKEKQNAFNTLKRMGLNSFTTQLQRFIAGLKAFWFSLKGDSMKIELTPEMVMEMGKEWGEVYLSGMPAEEVLSHFEPQQRLAGLTATERLVGLKPQELDELANYLNQRQRQKSSNC